MSPKRHTGTNREDSVLVRSLAMGLPEGHRVRAHDHPWGQVVYARMGVLSVETEGKRWILPPHRSLWVPAGAPHAVEVLTAARLRTVYLRPDLAEEGFSGIRVVRVVALLRELILEVVKRGILDESRAVDRSLANLLVVLLTEALEVPLDLPFPRDPRARRVAQRVMAAPGSSRSISALIGRGETSPRTIERLFAGETGLSVGNWQRRAVLHRAVHRLAEGVPVASVAAECGYGSSSAFVTMFKRSLGTTPGQYLDDPGE